MKTFLKIVTWCFAIALGFMTVVLFIRPEQFNLYAAATTSAVAFCSYIQYKKIKVGTWVSMAYPFLVGLFVPVLVIRLLAVL